PVFLGLEGAASIRNFNKPPSERDYFCMNHMHCNISAFLNAPWCARAEVISQKREAEFPSLWPAELCSRLLRAGKQIIYSPFMVQKLPAATPPSEDELLRFVREHHELMRDDPYYTPFGSLKAESLYSIAEPAERAAVLNPLFEKAGVPLMRSDKYEIARYKRREKA
ncbi:MAG TPA: hypothetical protein VEK08_00315, partial [Planctomycetota bacterium]|nr:hypothetical protein [Planctomycetota bacterium]